MGLSRQVYRANAKVAYRKFRANWAESKEELNGRQCPPFSVWLKWAEEATRKARAEAAKQAEAALAEKTEEFKEPEDLEWAE